VSRANSFVFRIRFVFPVCHGFPLVVSQDCFLAQLSSPPRRSGRAPLAHPAPRFHLSRSPPRAGKSSQSRSSNVGMRHHIDTTGRHLFGLGKSLVMQSSRVSTESPSLSTVSARSGSRKNPGRLPYTSITWLRPGRLVFGRIRYDAAIRLPESRLPPLLVRLVGHTRRVHDWMS
jgi:hypothetical protein